MSGGMILLNLMGYVALLLWATRLVKTGVLRAFGDHLRVGLQRATAGRVRPFLLGIFTAMALQSSAAALLLVGSFAGRGLIALIPALAAALGADIGSTLVIFALSYDLKALLPVLFIIGVMAFMLSGNAIVRQVGRIIIGLALMILTLGMIVSTSAALRENPTLAFLLSRLSDEPMLAAAIAALLAWLAHSSVAMVLLIISLTSGGIIGLSLAFALLAGVNLGAGLIPLGLGWQEGKAARRIFTGNFIFRTLGALVVLPLLPVLTPLMANLGLAPERAIAFAHMAFNLSIALVFLPLLGPAARALERALPDRDIDSASGARPLHLDESLLDRPQLALGAAAREVMRLAERVEAMLQDTLLTFSDTDDRRRVAIKKIDDEVDMLQEAIKLYLTRLTREPLSEADARRAFDLILFTTNLEHVGDIIDKNLLELAAKRQRNGLAFSDAGWAELTAFHARIVKQMKLAMTVFMTRDLTMARDLVEEKDSIRHLEKTATERHLDRLRQGTPASIETSALHLDMLRDLKRINAHIVSVAHPILEASGEMRESRLRRQQA